MTASAPTAWVDTGRSSRTLAAMAPAMVGGWPWDETWGGKRSEGQGAWLGSVLCEEVHR